MSRASAALALAAALVYLALVAHQLERPLMYDDANFALAARAVADTGVPFGNQGWMSDRGDFSQREQWALWHPPLYVYLDGWLAHLGGWTPPVLRLPGLVGGLASALLTFTLAHHLTRGPPAMRQLAGGIAAALFLACPLVVQSSLVLDIDFALLLPLTLAFLLLYVRLETSSRAWLWLAPLFAALLWAKMTNPVPLLGLVVVWQLLRGNVTRAGLHFVGIGLCGAALFGASWALVGRWLGFPLDMPFSVNLAQWQDSADVARRAYSSPGSFIEGLQPTVLWLGPGLVALGSIGVAVRAARLACGWRVQGAEVLIGLLAALVLGYVNKSAGWFPKYQVAMAPLLASLAAPLLASAVCTRPRLTASVAIVAALAALTITLRLVRDDWALQRTWAIEPTAGAWLLAVLIVGLAAGVPLRAAAATATTTLVGVAFGWALGLDLYQANAPYQTDYWYGTTGSVDAANWVDSHVSPDQTYLAAKEVAIRTHAQRYVDQDNLVYLLSTGRGFDGAWAGEPLQALVTWQREPYTADLFNRVLPSAGFREAGRFGDYVVYVPESTS